MQLIDKTALLTGASGGIGGAIAHELARRGARIVLSGRSGGRLERVRGARLWWRALMGHEALKVAGEIAAGQIQRR